MTIAELIKALITAIADGSAYANDPVMLEPCATPSTIAHIEVRAVEVVTGRPEQLVVMVASNNQ